MIYLAYRVRIGESLTWLNLVNKEAKTPISSNLPLKLAWKQGLITKRFDRGQGSWQRVLAGCQQAANIF